MMEVDTRTVGCPPCLLCHFLNCLAFYFLLELIQFTCCFKCIVKKSFSSKGSYCLSILSLVPSNIQDSSNTLKLKYILQRYAMAVVLLAVQCISDPFYCCFRTSAVITRVRCPGLCTSDMEVTPPSASRFSPHPHCLQGPWNGVPRHPLCLLQRIWRGTRDNSSVKACWLILRHWVDPFSWFPLAIFSFYNPKTNILHGCVPGSLSILCYWFGLFFGLWSILFSKENATP